MEIYDRLELQIMRQSDVAFSDILTKFGNGDELDENERRQIESRFRTRAWFNENVKGVIRLLLRNVDVDNYI